MANVPASTCELASQVAREIVAAAKEYDGPWLKLVAGRETPVPFLIEAPSLRGKSFESLESGGPGFGRLVHFAEEGSYIDPLGNRRPMRILNNYFFDLKVEEGVYTGWVEVRQRPDG